MNYTDKLFDSTMIRQTLEAFLKKTSSKQNLKNVSCVLILTMAENSSHVIDIFSINLKWISADGRHL